MTKRLVSASVLFMVQCSAFAYEGPSPLRNIKIDSSVTMNNSTGLFNYRYSVFNPKTNVSEISAIDITITRDPINEGSPSSTGLSYCPHHSEVASQRSLALTPIVAVGASTPKGWSCDHMPEGSLSFGAIDDPDVIKSGKSMGPFVLNSYGIPGIREVLVEPLIDYESFSPEWEGDSKRLEALQAKVNWLGKTIGPKAPPKLFVTTNFLDYLISLKDQSISLGWISGKELEKELDKIFARAKKKLSPCDQRELKEAIGELIEKAREEKKCKGLSSEARALLLYNAKYFLAQLPILSKADIKQCRHDDDHDHHEKHEDSNHKD